MTGTQEFLLSYLKFFDGFCKENGIEYFLAGGTLLGAIRHRGFLPWDDDVDLYIKSSEWERALEIFKTKLPRRYQITSRETSQDYHNSIIRIADTSTSAFYKSRLADNTNHGVAIELFRLDPMPSDAEKLDQYYSDYWTYTEAENPYAILSEGKLNYSKLSMKAYLEMERAFRAGDEKAIEGARAKLRFDAEDCITYHEDWASYWLTYPISAFREQLYVPFEDTMLPVPVDYADVLFGEYGDTWMEIPPAGKRAMHNDIENYDIPYKYMEVLIDAQLDKKKYLKAIHDRKLRLVEREFRVFESTRRKHMLYNNYLLEYYKREGVCDEIRGAYEERDWLGLLKLTEGIRDRQWEAFTNHYVYELPSNIMFYILYASIILGEFKYIDRVEKSIRGEVDSRTQEIFDDLRMLRQVRYSYYYNNMDAYREEHRRMLEKYPEQVILRTLDLIYRMEDCEDISILLAELRELQSKAGVRPRLRKLEADLLSRSISEEDRQEAEIIYEELLKTANDGMVINEIIRMTQEQLDNAI